MKARDLIVVPSNLKDVRSFVETNHYSHSVNGVKISFCFSILHQQSCPSGNDNCQVGAVIFGMLSTTAWKRFADTESKVIELRRLVLVDEAERNSESRVIGHCLRWLKKNAPQVEVVVSYADPKHGHSGVIYKASNFEYLGVGAKDTGYYDLETGKTYHSRALRTKYKGHYKPFVVKLRDKLASGILVPVELPGKHCYIYNLKSRRP